MAKDATAHNQVIAITEERQQWSIGVVSKVFESLQRSFVS